LTLSLFKSWITVFKLEGLLMRAKRFGRDAVKAFFVPVCHHPPLRHNPFA
jgi:hypothetical protein